MSKQGNDLLGSELRSHESYKWVAVVGSIFAYLGFVGYSEWHFYRLITGFLPGDAQVVGVVAVAVTAISALILPLALHFWVRVGKQRTLTLLFTAIHLVIVFANMVLDSALVSGDGAALRGSAFMSLYGTYILPGIVAVYALGWMVIWITDPDAIRIDEEREAAELARSGKVQRKLLVLTSQNEALEQAFQSTAAREAVNRWAARNAPRLLAAEMGMTEQDLPTRGGDFSWWEEEGQRGLPPAQMAVDGAAGAVNFQDPHSGSHSR